MFARRRLGCRSLLQRFGCHVVRPGLANHSYSHAAQRPQIIHQSYSPLRPRFGERSARPGLRVGHQLGPFITEPYVGDYLIKLRRTEAFHRGGAAECATTLNSAFDGCDGFHGFLDDLIGDLQLAHTPVEINLFSPDCTGWKRTRAESRRNPKFRRRGHV